MLASGGCRRGEQDTGPGLELVVAGDRRPGRMPRGVDGKPPQHRPHRPRAFGGGQLDIAEQRRVFRGTPPSFPVPTLRPRPPARATFAVLAVTGSF